MRRYVAVYKGLGGYATLGLEIVFAIVLAMLAGNWLDGRFGTAPTLLWVGFAFGVATAIWSVLNAVRMMRKETEREEAEQGNPEPLFETDSDRRAREKDRAFAADLAAEDRGGGDAEPGSADPAEPVDADRSSGPPRAR